MFNNIEFIFFIVAIICSSLLAPSSKAKVLSAAWQVNIKLSVILDLPNLARLPWRVMVYAFFFYSFGATVTTAARLCCKYLCASFSISSCLIELKSSKMFFGHCSCSGCRLERLSTVFSQ